MTILKPVTDKEIQELIYADKQRKVGWITAITPRDRNIANHFKREGAKEMLVRIKTDNPGWATNYKEYLDMLEAKL